MPATGLKIVGPGTCLPRCSISSFQNSLKTSGHRGYEFLEFWCWNLFPFFPDIVFTCWRVSGRLWWIFRLDASNVLYRWKIRGLIYQMLRRNNPKFYLMIISQICVCVIHRMNVQTEIVRTHLSDVKSEIANVLDLVRNWMVSALCLVNDS